MPTQGESHLSIAPQGGRCTPNTIQPVLVLDFVPLHNSTLEAPQLKRDAGEKAIPCLHDFPGSPTHDFCGALDFRIHADSDNFICDRNSPSKKKYQVPKQTLTQPGVFSCLQDNCAWTYMISKPLGCGGALLQGAEPPTTSLPNNTVRWKNKLCALSSYLHDLPI